MARIFYSMAGEGRGHAARARAMVEALRGEHELTLFAPGDAYDLLAPAYGGSDVRVFRIPGLRFHYTTRHSIAFGRTIQDGCSYLWRYRRLVGRIKRSMREDGAELAITDFEPALARAAEENGVPYVSLDHQHFLVVNDLSGLPRELRWKAQLMGQFVGFYCHNPAEIIVSQFYAPPLRPEFSHVTQVGVLLRPEVLATRPQPGQHVLAYLRREMPANVLEAFRELGVAVKVYGLGEHPRQGKVEFLPISQQSFIEDLASAAVVVSTAGNQLVGEALFLRKPVLAMPEANNFEQRINAHYLREGGWGEWVEPHELSVSRLRAFLQEAGNYVARIDPDKVAGNRRALEVIARRLPSTVASRQATLPDRSGSRAVRVPLPAEDIEQSLEHEEIVV